MAELEGSIGASAVKFTILTASRLGEVVGATLAEIDFKARVWPIAAERMKTGREHRVPLSDAAVARIEATPALAPTLAVTPLPEAASQVASDHSATAQSGVYA